MKIVLVLETWVGSGSAKFQSYCSDRIGDFYSGMH